MVSLSSATSITVSLFVTPLLMFALCVIFLASIGKSLGVRRLFVKLLLIVFEYGRVNIEAKRKRQSDNDGDHAHGKPSDIHNSTTHHPDKHKNGYIPQQNGNNVISRDDKLILVPEPPLQSKDDNKSPIKSNADDETSPDDATIENMKQYGDFELSNCIDYIICGIESIIEDQVTSRFEAEELKNWNLLTRTNRNYEFISWRLTIIWMCGFVLRYFILFPLRVVILFFAVVYLLITTAMISRMPDGRFRRIFAKLTHFTVTRIMVRSISSLVTFHNQQYRPPNGICVANHTSVIDVMILSVDNMYSLIGQSHGGFLGILQRALARASPHIWFERSEIRDRHAVAAKLKEHVSNSNNPPILIFPEGTCINNTSVMQFKKGSFEIDTVIYPVAIKYDPRFGDAFWNSSRYTMMQYLYMMMTSWAIVCDVWYLPPMYKEEGESAIDFANRVKSVIAKQGGLVDLVWDGQLKRSKPKKEWRERQQEEFSKRLILD